MLRLSTNFLLIILALSNFGFAKPLILENDLVVVYFDNSTGSITKIINKKLGQHYRIDDKVFMVELGVERSPGTLGKFTPENCLLKEVSSDSDKVKFIYTKDNVEIRLAYTLDAGDGFILKKVDLRYQGKTRYNISRFEMFDFSVDSKPAEVITYYGFYSYLQLRRLKDSQENPPSDNSTAFFLRYKDAGLFTALTCDYVSMRKNITSNRYVSVYWPGYILAPSETFESEYGIIGVYNRKGYFHEPCQPKSELKDFLYPSVNIKLDRGEIDIVEQAVEKFIKLGVYYTIVNGWGLGLPRYIEDKASMEAFKTAVDVAAGIPQLQGLHFVHGLCGLSREFHDQGLNMVVSPNKYADEAFRYAGEKKIDLSMFIGISNNYPAHFNGKESLSADLDLLSVDSNGKRRPNNIAISKKYTDFIYNTVVALKAKYPNLQGLSYDFLVITPDYANNRDYLPGRCSLYPQYANMRKLNRRLRQTFPDLMLRGQIGWRSLGPWLAENMSMCHNATDHRATFQRNFLDFHIDHHYANNIRLSNWFANNCKICPRHKMNSNSIHNGGRNGVWDFGAWEYCVLSQIATGQVFGALHNLPNQKNGEFLRQQDKEFFEKWIKWQKAHQDYYLRENEIFGEPRLTGIDGYAYSNGKNSILFLCNPTFQSHNVAVPVNHEIHLSSGKSYVIKELYPQERYRFGVDNGLFDYGSSFALVVPAQTVMVFEVEEYNPTNSVLLGVQGKIASDANGFVLSDLSGPTGQTSTLGIKLSSNYAGPNKLIYNGQVVETMVSGDILLARVKFAGDEIEPEVKDYKISIHGDRMKVIAKLHLPGNYIQILESQDMKLSCDFGEQRLNRAAWIDWSRFIIYLPILPRGYEPDKLKDEVYEKMIKEFDISAKLDGEEVKIHSNLFSDGSGQRWSGFFIDASKIAQNEKNIETLELDMPVIPEGNFYGIYMPNLTSQMMNKFEFLSTPSKLTFDQLNDVEEAFIQKPIVSIEDGKIKAFVKLTITSKRPAYMDICDIGVKSGSKSEMYVGGLDNRWLADKENGKILLSNKPKNIYLIIEGDDAISIVLGSGAGACNVPIAEMIKKWHQASDPYQPLLGQKKWIDKDATVAIKLVGPLTKPLALIDNM